MSVYRHHQTLGVEGTAEAVAEFCLLAGARLDALQRRQKRGGFQLERHLVFVTHVSVPFFGVYPLNRPATSREDPHKRLASPPGFSRFGNQPPRCTSLSDRICKA